MCVCRAPWKQSKFQYRTIIRVTVRVLKPPYRPLNAAHSAGFGDVSCQGQRAAPSAAAVRVEARPSPRWEDRVDIMSLCVSLLSLCPAVCSARTKMPLYVSLDASILVSMETHFYQYFIGAKWPCAASRVFFCRLNVQRQIDVLLALSPGY